MRIRSYNIKKMTTTHAQKWQTLTINISLREAERHFFLRDSFVSCKNASNELNFIKIGDEGYVLDNYHILYRVRTNV